MKFLDVITDKVKQDKPYRVVFYGPSTTSVDFVFPNWGQVIQYVLRDKLTEITKDYKRGCWNLQISNRGLDGAGSGDLLKRCETLVLIEKPDLVILSIGKNDAYYGVDVEETGKNARELISDLLGRGIGVIFQTSVPSSEQRINDKVNDYVEMDREIAEEFLGRSNFVFVDFYKLFPKDLIAKSYSLITEDGNEIAGFGPGDVDAIHFNKMGNLIVAKIFLKEVFDIEFDENRFFNDLNDLTKKYPEY